MNIREEFEKTLNELMSELETKEKMYKALYETNVMDILDYTQIIYEIERVRESITNVRQAMPEASDNAIAVSLYFFKMQNNG
jgi:hypothetical protein